ncbi:hypothetical protein [Caldithrix abyssi]
MKWEGKNFYNAFRGAKDPTVLKKEPGFDLATCHRTVVLIK